MAPGEKREMAVVFYVDPALVKDSENDGLNTITLPTPSIPVREPAPKPLAAASGEPDKREGQPLEIALGRRAPAKRGLNSKFERIGPAGALTERPTWPRRKPSITTITSSIRARGRSSARSRPSSWRSARSPGCTT